ncbi:MAG: DUF3592 domain-containing protein [Clostridia bacterium]|nr:DUF3592 domain-containing protein [Clostridia bacterium]
MNKLARFLRNTGPARFFLPLGVFLIVFGIIMLVTSPKEYSETTGIIKEIKEDVEDGSTVYDVYFEYTVDGISYPNCFENLGKGYSVGDEIKVYYDPANPEKVSNTKATGIIAPIMIVASGIALAYAIYATVKAFRKSKALDDQIKEATGSDTLREVVPLPKEELTEYYVMFDGKSLKPGYLVEDRSRALVYEAPMTKNSLVGNRIFTFTNHVTGRTQEHEVGHTVKQEYSGEMFTESSYFKFDGKNIWDCIHEKGIRVSTDLFAKLPKVGYTVSLNGQFFATIETSSKYVHEEDEKEHTVAVPVGKYYYRCWTSEPEQLDLLFLTVFAISETDQTIVE